MLHASFLASASWSLVPASPSPRPRCRFFSGVSMLGSIVSSSARPLRLDFCSHVATACPLPRPASAGAFRPYPSCAGYVGFPSASLSSIRLLLCAFGLAVPHLSALSAPYAPLRLPGLCAMPASLRRDRPPLLISPLSYACVALLSSRTLPLLRCAYFVSLRSFGLASAILAPVPRSRRFRRTPVPPPSLSLLLRLSLPRPFWRCSLPPLLLCLPSLPTTRLGVFLPDL